jgi:hypothetical protein
MTKALLRRRNMTDHIPEITFLENKNEIQDSVIGTELRICKTETVPCDDDGYDYVSVSWIALGVMIVGFALVIRKQKRVSLVKVVEGLKLDRKK